MAGVHTPRLVGAQADIDRDAFCPQPLVATCHGWVDGTAMLRLYNALDRRSAFVSDAVTVPDPP